MTFLDGVFLAIRQLPSTVVQLLNNTIDDPDFNIETETETNFVPCYRFDDEAWTIEDLIKGKSVSCRAVRDRLNSSLIMYLQQSSIRRHKTSAFGIS